MTENIKYQISIDAQAAIKAVNDLISSTARLNAAVNNSDQAVQKMERQLAQLEKRLREVTKSAGGAGAATKKMGDQAGDAAKKAEATEKAFAGLANTRYALYDVARTLGVVSVATLGVSIAIIKVASDFETMFAAVQRTSQTSGAQFGQLREELIDISTQIPATVDDIATVATIAGQLGVAAGSIAEFTRTIMMFSAATGVAVEQASESIGRVAQLAKVSASEYENLASAIYQVGITSVSTEAQILKTAENIAAVAEQSGFAAKDTIALSSALASLGIRSENARGSLQRTFNTIESAVRTGGEELVQFAKIAGTSSSEFQAAWQADAAGAFYQLIEGLGEASDRGEDLNAVLESVGIVGVRNTDVLRRLAGNTEVYATAIDESSRAYADGTALAEGYSITAETLSARLQTLSDTVRAIIDTMTDNSVVKVFVDLLQKVASAALAIGRTSLGPVIGLLVVGFGALVGVVTLAVAGMALATASAYAMITAGKFLVDQKRSEIGTLTLVNTLLEQYAVSTGKVTASQFQAAVSATGFKGALQGVAAASATASTAIKGIKYAIASTGVLLAVVALGEAFAFFQRKLDESDVQPFTDDVEGLMGALKGDTASALEDASKEITSFYVGVDEAGKVFSGAESQAMNYEDAMNNMGKSVEDATKRLTAQKIVVGDLTREWLYNQLVMSEGGDEIAAAIAQIEPILKDAGVNIKDVFDAAIKGEPIDLSSVRQQLVSELGTLQQAITESEIAYTNAFNELQQGGNPLQTAENVGALKDAWIEAKTEFQDFGDLEAFDNFNAYLDDTNGALIETIKNGSNWSAVSKILIGDLEEEGDEIETTTQKLKEFVDEQLAATDATAALRDNLFGLGEALAENGTTLDMNTEAGRANYSAISQTIALMREQAGGDQTVFDASLTSLLNMLQGMGFINSELSVFHSLLSGVTPSIGGVAKASVNAGTAIYDGFNKGTAAMRKTKKAAREVREEVRTLSDYVSDLSKVMKDAFDFRFGLQKSVDDTADAIRKIAEAFDDARNDARDLRIEMEDLRATLMGLSADRDILEYQLTVAVEYGDTLRAGEIRAELAQNEVDANETRAELSDATKDLSKAEEFLNAKLEGGTESAADHRDMILDLVDAYQKQIIEYANTGASQQQVEQYARRLNVEFQNQARELGYNKGEIVKYSASFNDMITIINRMPRNLTVDVNADPALRALAEYNAALNNTRANANAGGFSPASPYTGALSKYSRLLQLLGTIKQYSDAYQQTGSTWAKNNLDYYNAKVQSGNYWGGGYTGNGGKYEPAGTVHKGEYVITKERTAQLGVPFLNALGRSTEGYAAGGAVNITTSSPSTVMAEISPSSLRKLANAVSVQLTVDGKVLASTVNSVNAQTNQRGVARV